MKLTLAIITVGLIIASCNQSTQSTESGSQLPITGTWKLLTGSTIEGGDTVYTDYTSGKSAIKMINQTHFAFFVHDLAKGTDSTVAYSSGSGRYKLSGNTYKEHLEYCTYREWEDHDFEFTVTIKDDTLVQTGVEQVAELGINRINTETYVRLN